MSTEQAPVQKPAKIDGARRMGVTFNPGKDPRIDEVKLKFAELHDLIDKLCGEHFEKPFVDDGIARSEIGRACSTALTHLQLSKIMTVEALTR